MVEEMKSVFIENRLNAYFDGVILPRIDLSRAKSEVRKARSRRRRNIAFAVLSAAASLVFVVAVALANLPSRADRKLYSIADATPTSVSYTSLNEEYSAVTAPFAPFSIASNTSAEYTLYEVKGQEVLLRIDIAFVGNGTQAHASVYVDLSNGKRTPEELVSYKEIEGRYFSGYRYDVAYEGGEYVSEAYGSLPSGEACYIDMTSNNSQTLIEFIRLIRR